MLYNSYRRKEILWEGQGNGPLAQLVRALACHARGRGFEPHAGRHFVPLLLWPRALGVCLCSSVGRAGDWKSPCRWFDSDRRHHLCGFSSSGRAPPCQGGGSEFEPRNPLHYPIQTPRNRLYSRACPLTAGSCWSCGFLLFNFRGRFGNWTFIMLCCFIISDK